MTFSSDLATRFAMRQGRRHLYRRRFCLCCLGGTALAATGAWLPPRRAFAEARGLVSLIKDSAATAPHWHFDHTDGNTWLKQTGTKIIAQENTRRYLSQVRRVDDWDYNFLPLPPDGVPDEVFARDHAMRMNGASLRLKYYGSAHTDSDISVTFGEADVMHVGDTFCNGVYPFIDYSTGGSIDGMIAAADANLAATTHSTLIIAGHGRPVGRHADLKDFPNMLVTICERVAVLKRQGRSCDDVVAARPTAAFDAVYGQFAIDPGFFTRLVYEGV